MNRPSDDDARLIAWLDEGATRGPERVLLAALAQTRSTRQDRIRFGGLGSEWRFQPMPRFLKVTAVAVLALAVGLAVGPMSTSQQSASHPSPSPVPPVTPAPLHQGRLAAGDYTVTPFAGDAWAPCGPAEGSCLEAARDDSIRFTLTVPDGWAGAPLGSDIWLDVENNDGPDGAGFLLGRGGWLYSEPCSDMEDPDIPVGPTVDDFVGALLAHPSLEVIEPVETSLGGWTGRYLEIQGPADLTDCPAFLAWGPTFHAQGPDNRWLIWVVDVDGVRVVVHGSEFPGTTPDRSAELRAIVASLRIDTATQVTAEPSPVPSVAESPPATFVADGFAWPFEYTIPTGAVVTTSTREMYAFTEGSRETYPGSGYEDVRGVRGVTVSFGLPASTHPAGSGRDGLLLRPEAFFEDLRGNPALFVGPVSSARVGGLAARQADVRGVEGGWGGAYPDLHLAGASGASLNFPGTLIATEIEGGSLVVHIWAATEEELAIWRPIAAGLVASIRFLEPPPTPRPAMSP